MSKKLLKSPIMNNKLLCHTIIVFFLLSMFGYPAFGQIASPEQARGEGEALLLALFMSEPVQKELNLLSDQRRTIKELYAEYLNKRCIMNQALTSDKDQGVMSSREAFERALIETNKIYIEILQSLRALQSIRWREIILQTFGWASLTNPDMVESMNILLGLTNEQKQEFAKLNNASRDQMRKYLEKEQGAALCKLERELMAQTDDKVWSLLNEEQRSILNKMQGKRFALRGKPPRTPKLECGSQ